MSKRLLTEAQILLAKFFRELGLKPEYEVPICKGRRWRFDVADRELMLACEANGSGFYGSHTRAWSHEKEYERRNAAQIAGWTVLEFSNRQISDGRAKQVIKQWVER